MSSKWYGSINNRIDENKMYCDEIKVGTGMTKYFYSDREPYEVTKVIDQQHVFVRKLDHKHVGNGEMDNNWELISNPNNPETELQLRNGVWMEVKHITKQSLLENAIKSAKGNERAVNSYYNYVVCMLHLTEKQKEKIENGGLVNKFQKFGNVSFGVAEYYYDYEF